MGLEDRLAGEIPLNLPMDTLLDPDAARAALMSVGRELKERGAESLILGCTGMAHHRAIVRERLGIPVIEPSQAAAAVAIGAVIGDRA
jgi:allantoin racemase